MRVGVTSSPASTSHGSWVGPAASKPSPSSSSASRAPRTSSPPGGASACSCPPPRSSSSSSSSSQTAGEGGVSHGLSHFSDPVRGRGGAVEAASPQTDSAPDSSSSSKARPPSRAQHVAAPPVAVTVVTGAGVEIAGGEGGWARVEGLELVKPADGWREQRKEGEGGREGTTSTSSSPLPLFKPSFSHAYHDEVVHLDQYVRDLVSPGVIDQSQCLTLVPLPYLGSNPGEG